ncbi:MAG: SpoIIE family protein phosphatase [Bacteroidales bacterium]
MDKIKIKVWGLIYLSKKQILIFETVFLTIFILMTVFLFSYEFKEHIDSEILAFHAKYTKYISLACTFLIIIETQYLWSQFTKAQLDLISQQKREIEDQKDQIEKQNNYLKASIRYASRIQSALLPSNVKMGRLLKDHFLYFKPRDVVSGDFYWIDEHKDKIIVAVADCTGHGVPGAFVSVLGISFLNEIVQHSIVHKEELNPAIILNKLRVKMMDSLIKAETDSGIYDGMDISVCIIDKKNKCVDFSGAMHPICIIRKFTDKKPEIEKLRSDVQSISLIGTVEYEYTSISFNVSKGDMIYMYSDGFADQFGGKDGKKFLSRNFEYLLLKISQEPLENQSLLLQDKIERWRGQYKQVDDILVLGIRV